MNKPLPSLLRLLFIASVAVGAASPLLGQQSPQTRVSPQDTVGVNVGGAEIKIVYGRPFSKDAKSGEVRKIWGGLVPFGKVWRTGANEATLLTTSAPIQFGGSTTTIPAGTYSLFTLPEEGGGAKLIVNKQTGQWGTKYDEKQDLVRVDLKKEATEKPIDQFTMAVEKNAADSRGVLKMMWENTQYSAPFTVKR